MTMTQQQIDAAEPLPRLGSTRAAVPGALRARRRARVLAPLGGALAAAAVASAILPGILAAPEPALADELPSVSQLATAQPQAFSADLGLGAGAVEREGAEVTVTIPTPTPTPTASSSSSSGSGSGSSYGATTPASVSQEIAHALVLGRGWSESDFTCLVKLWNKESRWEVDAENPSSGAYGIPQALPGSKMSSVGDDWRTNPETQIRWGLGYIADRYGTPCGAWSHSQGNGWY